MKSQLLTYYLRKLINHLVDSTLTGPSLAEMVRHHLTADWVRVHLPPYPVIYQVYDRDETFIELRVTDASGYPDDTYEKGCALLKIAVNGALLAPEDEAYARRVFPLTAFRTCPICRLEFGTWFEYYGHVKLDHMAHPLTG